jgi:NTE family protein
LFIENYRAHSYAAGGINCVFNITNRLDFRLEAYVFQPYQKILKDDDLNPYYAEPFEYRYYITSSSLIYHTPIGPASFSFNYYEGASNPYFLFFNFGYILFNKRALD